MYTVDLSIEELIFSFYSEGYFEQGLALKQSYFPDISDEQLEFIFQIACRSLLAKDMVEWQDAKYRIKASAVQLIKSLNYANKTIKLSRFAEKEEEHTLAFHITGEKIFSHELLHEGQVHRITDISDAPIQKKINAFFKLKETQENDKVLIRWSKEELEKLLFMSSEGTLQELQASIEKDNNILLSIFANDLYNRKGKMDSMLELEYDEHNNPLIISLTFIIPGESQTWMITGAAENNFSLQIFNEKFVEKAIFIEKTVSAHT